MAALPDSCLDSNFKHRLIQEIKRIEHERDDQLALVKELNKILSGERSKLAYLEMRDAEICRSLKAVNDGGMNGSLVRYAAMVAGGLAASGLVCSKYQDIKDFIKKLREICSDAPELEEYMCPLDME